MTTPHARDEREVSRFVENFAVVLTDSGLPRMPARVFSCLLASEDGHMTAGELADGLQVSLAGISGAVRYLTNIGLIRRGRQPGARRDYYMVQPDMWYQTFAERDSLLKRWQESVSEGADVVGRDSGAGRRLTETEEFFGFLRQELPLMMDRWVAHRQRWHAAQEDLDG